MKKFIKTYLFVFLALLSYILGYLLEAVPNFYETYYARTINKWTIQGISHLTGLFPFSIAEWLYLSQWILVPLALVFPFIAILRKKWHGWRSFRKWFKVCVNYLAIVFILFQVIWGFHYGRMSLGENMGLVVQGSTVDDLAIMNRGLIEQANQLRENIELDSEGVMRVEGGYQSVFKRAPKGYAKIEAIYPFLSGSFGRPKAIALSKPMLYTGITGMYFPFTGEANINVAIPDLLLPTTVLHEMAHQRGIAPENEANFVAYLTGIYHPDKDFQYSAAVLALIHSMNALYRVEPELASKLAKNYSEGLKLDLQAHAAFWKNYEGKVNEAAERVNDTYLKSNRQSEGVKSYGQMVDLLLAYWFEVYELERK